MLACFAEGNTAGFAVRELVRFAGTAVGGVEEMGPIHTPVSRTWDGCVEDFLKLP